MAYDVIGDIHGHADQLEALLVNRRPNGTHYRRAKGDHLAALRWG